MTVRINPIVSGNREIEEIEERYKLNLHKQWKVRLPDDLLVVCLSVDCYSSFIFLPVSMMTKNMLEWVRSSSIVYRCYRNSLIEHASENVLRSGGDCFELLMISDGRQRTDQLPK